MTRNKEIGKDQAKTVTAQTRKKVTSQQWAIIPY